MNNDKTNNSSLENNADHLVDFDRDTSTQYNPALDSPSNSSSIYPTPTKSNYGPASLPSQPTSTSNQPSYERAPLHVTTESKSNEKPRTFLIILSIFPIVYFFAMILVIRPQGEIFGYLMVPFTLIGAIATIILGGKFLKILLYIYLPFMVFLGFMLYMTLTGSCNNGC